MNMVLGEVEERRRILESGQEESRETRRQTAWRQETRKRGMLFIRGDAVILVAPLSKRKS